jgi:hypothetical protein
MGAMPVWSNEMSPELLQSHLTKIDKALADHDRSRAHVEQLHADRDRKSQEIRFAPWLAVTAGMTTGAALFAAGAPFIKLIG